MAMMKGTRVRDGDDEREKGASVEETGRSGSVRTWSVRRVPSRSLPVRREWHGVTIQKSCFITAYTSSHVFASLPTLHIRVRVRMGLGLGEEEE